MNYRDSIQKIIYQIIDRPLEALLKRGVTPNQVTFIGFLGNVIAAVCIGKGHPGWGGLLLILFGILDMADGRMARKGGLTSRFGALWDSALDRYSELATLSGIAFYFVNIWEMTWVWVTLAALAGSLMVSYVRARAEGLGIECKGGLMQRPERVVVTAVTALLTGITGQTVWLAGGMALIAVLANITAFHRLADCYRKLK